MKRILKGLTALVGVAVAVVAGLVIVYRRRIRPWHVRWGANDDEVAQPMPGDDMVPDANLQTTRALTIAAPPDRVWPWLVQIGQGRGGFYSYDLLENLAGLSIHSASHILPEHQQLSVGDTIAVEPDGSGFRVVELNPERLLLLFIDGSGEGAVCEHFRRVDGASSWAFALTPLDGGRTRLVVRWRARYPTIGSQELRATVIGPALEPVEFVMERKMLQGIRERAELHSKRTLIDEFLPDFEYSDARTISVEATAQDVCRAAKELTGNEISPVAELLLQARGLPGRLQGEEAAVSFAGDGAFLETLYRQIFIPLGETPDQEIVFGIIGKFWEASSDDWPAIRSPQEYLAFNDPAYGKVAANLLIQPGREPGTVLLSTETRIHVPGPELRRSFGRYWTVISGGSGFIRQQWLKAIKRRAESNQPMRA
jgi:hypothetical protein